VRACYSDDNARENVVASYGNQVWKLKEIISWATTNTNCLPQKVVRIAPPAGCRRLMSAPPIASCIDYVMVGAVYGWTENLLTNEPSGEIQSLDKSAGSLVGLDEMEMAG
jgi:hypothetical protein